MDQHYDRIIFYTTEGFTQAPDGEDIENYQLLGRAYGKDKHDAANLCDRRFAGIEQSEEFCQMSKARREELDNVGVKADLKRHIVDFKTLEASGQLDLFEENNGMVCEDCDVMYGLLPFDTKPLQ